MKILKAVLLVVLAIVVVGAVAGLLLVRSGFRATATPPWWESALARDVRNVAIPNRERAEKNPFARSSEASQQGREFFLTQCAACHGIDGSGKTPLGLDRKSVV